MCSSAPCRGCFSADGPSSAVMSKTIRKRCTSFSLRSPTPPLLYARLPTKTNSWTVSKIVTSWTHSQQLVIMLISLSSINCQLNSMTLCKTSSASFCSKNRGQRWSKQARNWQISAKWRRQWPRSTRRQLSKFKITSMTISLKMKGSPWKNHLSPWRRKIQLLTVSSQSSNSRRLSRTMMRQSCYLCSRQAMPAHYGRVKLIQKTRESWETTTSKRCQSKVSSSIGKASRTLYTAINLARLEKMDSLSTARKGN